MVFSSGSSWDPAISRPAPGQHLHWLSLLKDIDFLSKKQLMPWKAGSRMYGEQRGLGFRTPDSRLHPGPKLLFGFGPTAYPCCSQFCHLPNMENILPGSAKDGWDYIVQITQVSVFKLVLKAPDFFGEALGMLHREQVPLNPLYQYIYWASVANMNEVITIETSTLLK